ncbi:MAG: hypothetical protein R3B52_02455 [Candidatus Paceibacterota bacterium]
MPEYIKIDLTKEEELKKELQTRTDAESQRQIRFLDMPDLSRTEGSPIYELAQKITNLEQFKDFSVVQVPEIVPVAQSFDLFDFPADHPARSKSDTYYVTDEYILRPHTTVSWYYYLNSEEAKKKIANNETLGVLTYGKVYRKDELDKRHMNVFHQIDGYYLVPKDKGTIGVEDLKEVLANIAKTVFGDDIEYRFNKDTFPYTDPSLEMEINIDGHWVEVLGSGVVKGSVLEKLGVDSSNYTGWAFGFGLERLAIISMKLPDIRLLWSKDDRVVKQLKLGNVYKEVSKYPPVVRDISFIVDKSFVPNNYFDLIRDIGGNLVEEVALLDKYEDAAKFGENKVSYTYRIHYRSIDKTLTAEEVEPIQKEVENQTVEQFQATIR